MADKVRIGFIGSGNISIGHAQRLFDSGLAEVVALSDPSEASIKRLKENRPELADVPVYSDYRQMIAQASLDAVEIHSPHCYHPQQIMEALDAGKHVLCEKPLTSSVAEAKQVLVKRDATGKVLMISYQRHFFPEYRYMREAAISGKLGKIQVVTLVLTQDWLRRQQGAWRLDPKISCGGQLNDSGSHVVDMMLWCTGLQADEVYAQINNYGAAVDIDSTITVRFTNGAIGNLTVLGSTPDYWEMFGMWGSEGGVSYNPTAGLLVHRFGSQAEKLDLPKSAQNPDVNFVKAILGEDEVQVPAECGLRVIELTEAAWRSAASGKPVKVAEM